MDYKSQKEHTLQALGFRKEIHIFSGSRKWGVSAEQHVLIGISH